MEIRQTRNKSGKKKESGEVYLSVLGVLSDKKRIILSILVAAFFFAFMFGIIYKRNYTASIYIYSEINDEIQSDLNRAAGDDYSVLIPNRELPFETYSAILRSPQVQMDILQAKYSVNFKYKHYDMDLMQYFSLSNITYALQELNEITEIDMLENSNVLKLSVTTQYPDLSRQIAESYVNELEQYLSQRRQRQIEEKISMLDKTIQSVSEHDQLEFEMAADLKDQLERQKIRLMLAGRIGEFRLGSIRLPYTESNTRISEFAVIAMCLVSILTVIACIAVLKVKPSNSRMEKADREMRGVMLRRGPESAPEKPARQARKKSSPRERTQKKRTVEV
jgi:hypothetical protein